MPVAGGRPATVKRSTDVVGEAQDSPSRVWQWVVFFFFVSMVAGKLEVRFEKGQYKVELDFEAWRLRGGRRILTGKSRWEDGLPNTWWLWGNVAWRLFFFLFLLMCGDVKTNPGPRRMLVDEDEMPMIAEPVVEPIRKERAGARGQGVGQGGGVHCWVMVNGRWRHYKSAAQAATVVKCSATALRSKIKGLPVDGVHNITIHGDAYCVSLGNEEPPKMQEENIVTCEVPCGKQEVGEPQVGPKKTVHYH
jgi:hypothetical protein